MKNFTKEKTYLTPSDVAELLLVSPVTVRQWVQKGLLKAESTPGGHRRFLRRDIERFAHKRGLSLSRAGDDNVRVLIVDDDKQLARFLVEFLADYSNIVTDVAHDGFEAGQKVNLFKPNIMLMDLMMPGVNGFQVCRQLKAEPSTEDIRIIAMTGYYSQENIDGIVSAGAETCLRKPLDTEALLDAIGLVEKHTNVTQIEQ